MQLPLPPGFMLGTLVRLFINYNAQVVVDMEYYIHKLQNYIGFL